MFGTLTKTHFLIHTSTKTVFFFFFISSLNSIVYLFVGCLPCIYFPVPSNAPVVYVGRLIPVLDSKMDPNPHHPSQWLVQRWTRGPKKANQTRRFSSRTSTPGRSRWGSALLTSLLIKARCKQPWELLVATSYLPNASGGGSQEWSEVTTLRNGKTRSLPCCWNDFWTFQ